MIHLTLRPMCWRALFKRSVSFELALFKPTAIIGCWLLLSGSLMAKTQAEPLWTPIIEPYEHIYPAFQMTTEALAQDSQNPVEGLVGIRIKLPKRKGEPMVQVRVKISEPELLIGETLIQLPSSGNEQRIYPQLAWRLLALKSIARAQRRTLEFSVQIGAAAPERKQFNAIIHGLNDALVYVEGDQPSTHKDDLDFNWIFAAYVDSQSQAVKRLKAAALKLGIVDQLSGYQVNGDQDAVHLQVFSLYQALQNRGVRYVGKSENVSAHPKILSQRVRFPDESWQGRVVNCVDGSVLFAAALANIGIEPVLVVIPGHMFVGFYLDEGQENLEFLDLSLLGQTPVDVDITEAGESTLVGLQNQVPADLLPEFAVFTEAVALAERQFNKAQNKFDLPDNPDYQIISISDARALGVQAIRASK